MLEHELLAGVSHGFCTRHDASPAEWEGFSGFCTPKQVHSNKCVFIAESEAEMVEADAYVTNVAGVLLGIVTADCLPVLMWEPCGIVAAAHAGWRGAIAGILDNTIACIESCGGKAENIRAVIGPAISVDSYEVKEDFLDSVLAEDRGAEVHFHKSEGRLYFNLPAYAEARLQQLSVGHVACMAEDTCSQGDRFFSYRRSVLVGEANYGRQFSAIGRIS